VVQTRTTPNGLACAMARDRLCHYVADYSVVVPALVRPLMGNDDVATRGWRNTCRLGASFVFCDDDASFNSVFAPHGTADIRLRHDRAAFFGIALILYVYFCLARYEINRRRRLYRRCWDGLACVRNGIGVTAWIIGCRPAMFWTGLRKHCAKYFKPRASCVLSNAQSAGGLGDGGRLQRIRYDAVQVWRGGPVQSILLVRWYGIVRQDGPCCRQNWGATEKDRARKTQRQCALGFRSCDMVCLWGCLLVIGVAIAGLLGGQ